HYDETSWTLDILGRSGAVNYLNARRDLALTLNHEHECSPNGSVQALQSSSQYDQWSLVSEYGDGQQKSRDFQGKPEDAERKCYGVHAPPPVLTPCIASRLALTAWSNDAFFKSNPPFPGLARVFIPLLSALFPYGAIFHSPDEIIRFLLGPSGVPLPQRRRFFP